MKSQIPATLKTLFWDVDSSKLDAKRHQAFIIERILEHGDEAAVRWLFEAFPKASIVAVAKTSRRLSAKSKNFWQVKLDVWPSAKRSSKKPAAIWSY